VLVTNSAEVNSARDPYVLRAFNSDLCIAMPEEVKITIVDLDLCVPTD